MIRSWWLRIVTIFLLIALFSYGFVTRSEWIKQMASYFVYPVLLVQCVLVDPIKQNQGQAADVEELQDQLSALQQEYQKILAENVQYKATLAYMNDIKELQEFKDRYQEHGHISQVLVRHFSSQEHYFLIDGGTNKNIQKDMVVVHQNNLIGRVTEVYPWYSKVSLVTDRNCKVAAYCAKTKAHGIHQGTNDVACTALSYVNHLEPIEEGDMVLSSGEGLIFPQGFSLGTIKTCHVDDLYKQISLEPCCDLRRLDYCVVMDQNSLNHSQLPPSADLEETPLK